MITAAQWAAMEAESDRVVAAMPPLTPEQVALACELLHPIPADKLRAARRTRKEAADARTPHPTRR